MDVPDADVINTDTMADTSPCVQTLTYPYSYSDTCEVTQCDK